MVLYPISSLLINLSTVSHLTWKNGFTGAVPIATANRQASINGSLLANSVSFLLFLLGYKRVKGKFNQSLALSLTVSYNYQAAISHLEKEG